MNTYKLYEGNVIAELIWYALFTVTTIVGICYIIIVNYLHYLTSTLLCMIILFVICIAEISFAFNARRYRIVFYQDGIDVPTVLTNDPDLFDVSKFRRTSITPRFFNYSEIERILPFYERGSSLNAEYIGLKIILKSGNYHYVAFIFQSNIRISVILYLLSKEKKWYNDIVYADPIGIEKSDFNKLWQRISYELKLLIGDNNNTIHETQLNSIVNYQDSWSEYLKRTYVDGMKVVIFISISLLLGSILLVFSNRYVIDLLINPLTFDKNISLTIISIIGLFMVGIGIYALFLLITVHVGPFKIDNTHIHLPLVYSSLLYDFRNILSTGRRYSINEITGIFVENDNVYFYTRHKKDRLRMHRIPKYYFSNSDEALMQIQRVGIAIKR